MSGLQRLDARAFTQATRSLRRFAEPQLDPTTQERLQQIFGRAVTADEAVRVIVADVRERGDDAVREWTRRIDGVEVTELLADRHTMADAWERTPPALREALTIARDRITAFHEHQVTATPLGASHLQLRPRPVRRAGAYVPGGRAAYPSTVLMNTIPARVAGVGSVVVATPPGPDGRAHPAVLAAAHLAGVDAVAVAGGAQAIAALAYGTASLPAVDVIVGPGNIFVTLAKRAVFGSCGVDGLAGPSEIVVVASRGADASFVAADMVSQLEHDPLAWAVCVTDDAALAAEVEVAFAGAVAEARRGGIVEQAAGRHAFCVLCGDMDEALEVVDGFAPEHLELVGDAAEKLVDRVSTAAAVFVGAQSPVPMGDYIAGPNHTLPTGGAARFKGPLSVMDFIRWTSVIRLDADEMRHLGPVAQTLAEAEGLHGHTRSIQLRLDAAATGAAAPASGRTAP